MTEPAEPPPGRHGITPSQTVGPFFAFCLTPIDYGFAGIFSNDIAGEDAVGERLILEGTVTDGDGAGVPDAMIELWQPDGLGRFAGHDPALSNSRFTGFGRTQCDQRGRFSFITVKPGIVPGPNGRPQAPHIDVSLFARGVVRRMFTRIYFEGDPANDADPILELVPAERRATLIARRTGPGSFVFDIRLQGRDETVFFEA
jgi:protocatechuate 3,4-dioxygenase, alpha subunit